MRLWPFIAIGAAGVAGAAYVRLFRPWQVRWGATDEEVRLSLPLDGRIAHPTVESTRALTVNARPEDIWPWLVQMGDGDRAGYYSYVWIERIMGMRLENSDRVLPQFQHLSVGDALDPSGTMRVQAIEPGSWLVLGPNETDASWLSVTWAFALYPLTDRATRLVTRVRARVNRWSPAAALWMAAMDPGVFVMEHKMLLGIKERAERLAQERLTQTSPRAEAN